MGDRTFGSDHELPYCVCRSVSAIFLALTRRPEHYALVVEDEARGDWQRRYETSLDLEHALERPSLLTDMVMFLGGASFVAFVVLSLCAWLATVIGQSRALGLAVGGATLLLIAIGLLLRRHRRRVAAR